jgi:hypothetical protein
MNGTTEKTVDELATLANFSLDSQALTKTVTQTVDESEPLATNVYHYPSKLSKLQKIFLVSALAGRETKYRTWCDFDCREARRYFDVTKRNRWEEPTLERSVKASNARKSIWRTSVRLQQRGLAINKNAGIYLTDEGVSVAQALTKIPEHQDLYQSELNRMLASVKRSAEVFQKLRQLGVLKQA